MQEMKVYIVNLGRYNEGKETGGWFTCPVDYGHVKERLKLDSDHEEYAIHDYELPFEIDEYMEIEKLNRLCSMVEELDENIQDDLEELLKQYGGLKELYDEKDEIVLYPGLSDMTDLTYRLVDEGLLGDIPDKLKMYFDYKAYARDLDINGRFVVGNHGIYELPW